LGEDSERRLKNIHARAFLLDVPDKFSATETLGKLFYKSQQDDLKYLQLRKKNLETDELLAYMSAWIIGDDERARESFLCQGINENTTNKLTPTICVWGLHYLQQLQNDETFATLGKAFLNKKISPEARMLAAELLLKYKKIDFNSVVKLKNELDLLTKNDRSWLYEQAWCQVLLYCDDPNLVMLELGKYLDSDNPELRIVSAWILLKKYRDF
jgi:hypothetical protein